MGIKKFIETLKNFGDTISSASWSGTSPKTRPTIRTSPYTFPRYTVSIPRAKATSRARTKDCFGVGPGVAILYRGK